MVSWPFLMLIAAFTKWSLSYTINICVIILTFLMGLGRNYFELRTSYPQNCLSMPLPRVAWTVFVPEPSSSPSVRLGVNSQSPTCTNKQGHFPADKGSPYAPVFICGPSSVIPSSVRCCNCLKKKISVPKGN